MRKFFKSERGMVDLFVVTVAVLVLIGAGVYLYARHLNSGAAYTPPGLGTGSKAKTTASTSSGSGLFKVPELGIEFALSSDISDLNYTVVTSGGTAVDGLPTAYFSTDSLKKADPACGNDAVDANAPLGSMWEQTSTFVNRGQEGEPTLIKTINGKYFYYEPPFANCSTNASVTAQAQQLRQSFVKALSSVQASK